ncbi:Retrovirus-related Pol polyprotein from transposon TNT 1-94 [Eumeta japonica]|uniref:Retrovirus-related Pol polyprotein from transposon TNT 1-94 n=1 Tax=Eumeta variegata TaxID=151549 RepID=A0A4C1T9K4_EUMVA|nr:Retrovirus-related Pol polyprotein from transposon TNT 1-94 [Eumeta japonica]
MDSTQGGSGQQNVMKLEGSRNWNVWKFQTSVLLRGQGLYKIVDGTTVKPEDDTQRSTWETQDGRAQTLIVTRMTEEVMLHIISCDTAAAMWRKLLSVYEQKSETSIHIVQQRFFQFKFEEGTEMSVFLSKVHEMQNQLKQLGENMSDKFVITKVLMSLPEDYKHFISAWESAPDDKQTYDNLVARLLIEEERIKEKGGPTPSTAFVAKKVKKV